MFVCVFCPVVCHILSYMYVFVCGYAVDCMLSTYLSVCCLVVGHIYACVYVRVRICVVDYMLLYIYACVCIPVVSCAFSYIRTQVIRFQTRLRLEELGVKTFPRRNSATKHRTENSKPRTFALLSLVIVSGGIHYEDN